MESSNVNSSSFETRLRSPASHLLRSPSSQPDHPLRDALSDLKTFIQPEIHQRCLEHLSRHPDPLVHWEVLGKVEARNKTFPLIGITLGTQKSDAPTFGVFGGVHGLERIGARVALNYLYSTYMQMQWDQGFRKLLEECRIVSIPVINPGGVFLKTRSNPQGVDLMRNAPIEAIGKPAFLVGGHRISPSLPWFRGQKDAPMEVESSTLLEFVRKNLFSAPTSFALDLHSGFGFQDRLWYPYAKTTEDFPAIQEARSTIQLLNLCYPHHIYKIEAQSQSYCTHGDLWDFLFDEHQAQHPGKLFIPWTLEMGSWVWVKKNPTQIILRKGLFNPVQIHRRRRILRRHLMLLQFFHRAIANTPSWLPSASQYFRA